MALSMFSRLALLNGRQLHNGSSLELVLGKECNIRAVLDGVDVGVIYRDVPPGMALYGVVELYEVSDSVEILDMS